MRPQVSKQTVHRNGPRLTPVPPGHTHTHTHLHDVVVNLHARGLHDAEVSLQVAPARVVVRHGVVRGAVEEDAGASIVLDEVVIHQGAENGNRETKHRQIASSYTHCRYTLELRPEGAEKDRLCIRVTTTTKGQRGG